jgi:hypothetical protein
LCRTPQDIEPDSSVKYPQTGDESSKSEKPPILDAVGTTPQASDPFEPEWNQRLPQHGENPEPFSHKKDSY